MDLDIELTKKAIEEIVHESHQFEFKDDYKERKTNPLGKLNKNFLGRTLNHVIRHNERESKRIRKKCRKKLKELDGGRRRTRLHESSRDKRSRRTETHRKRKHKHSHREKESYSDDETASCGPHDEESYVPDDGYVPNEAIDHYHQDLNNYAYAEEQYCRSVVLCYQALLKSTEDSLHNTQAASNSTTSMLTIDVSSDDGSDDEERVFERDVKRCQSIVELIDSDDDLVFSSVEPATTTKEPTPACIDLDSDSDESGTDVIDLTD